MIGRSAFAGIIIEGIFSSHDIYRFWQLKNSGRIDQEKFTDLILERLVIGVTSVAGGTLGNVIGFSVGGVLKCIIGGILGNILGRLFGRAVGSWCVGVFRRQA